MGKYKNGINGPFNGKIGHAVGASWLGIEYMRSLPRPSNKPPTEKQLMQRYILGMVSGWLRPLKDLITIGFQHFAIGQTAMNAAVSFLLSNSLIREFGQVSIDFSKAIFSRGDLLVSALTEMAILNGQVLYLRWSNAMSSALNNPEDLATFMIYNPAKLLFVTFKDAAERKDTEVMLQLPGNFAGDELHAYMHYVGQGGDRVSSTLYLGCL